ncbi:MAG TPA: ATP-binding cassette domain-containing protein [Nocardioidaceae bacterium]|nr:ATP-binding cassette domain-containing protein [Nocardioidaceae bacterium]
MSELVVQTTQLTKTYGARLAVDRVDMTVRRGEVYGFLGPNGAGKTTTLRMMLGLVRPTRGSARVLGRPAGDPAVTARTGALIEGPGFFPYLSGRENLRVMARYRGLGRDAVEEALARVALTDRGDDRFKGYSLGMKQRLGVASALMGDPELIVLDEPTNGLDPAGMADMRRLIVELASGGQTVVLSSHLLAEVQDICDRVGVIAGGHLLSESTVGELRGAASLRVRATPLDRAIAAGMRVAGDDSVAVDRDRLLITVSADRTPDVVRALVADGIDVHEVSTSERTLEEVFMEMTAAPAMGSQSQTDMEAVR